MSVPNYCMTIACYEAGVEAAEGQSFCPVCINKLTLEGWKLSPSGNRSNSKTGVKVTAAGTVTVTARYNARMLALMAGELAIEDLDDEELAKGACRNPDGSFPKRAPAMVPRSMYERMTKELFGRADEKLRENLLGAVQSLVTIAQSGEVENAVRLKAATYVLERLQGKTPDVVKVTQDKPYEVLLGGVHRGPRPSVAPTAEAG